MSLTGATFHSSRRAGRGVILSRFIRDEHGATAIEYGLIAAVTALVVIAAATNLSSAIAAKYTVISNALTGA